MLTRTFVLLSLCCLAAQPGWAQEAAPQDSVLSRLNLSGALRFDYFSSSKTVDGNADFFGATAQLKALPVFSDTFDAKIEARFSDPDVAHDDRVPGTALLLEGYLTMHIKQTDVRVGKQNVAWGRADALNPTDNLTPQDYTVLLPFQEDRRFGTTSLRVDHALTSGYAITLFTTPLFMPSKIPLPLPAGAVVQKNDIPAHTFSNSEVGVKLNKTGGETDWSVSYYHGYSLIPEIRLAGFSPPATLLLELRYPEIDVIGADLARNYGRYGFRVEAAYIWPKNYSSMEPTVLQPYLYYVLGVDRTFFENLNVNLQLVGRAMQHYQDPETIPDPVLRALTLENQILFGQQDRTTYGLTSRVSKRWLHDTLEAEVLVVVYFDPANTYVRPLVTYAFTDRLKGSVGSEVYSGPQDSFFGLLKPNQGIFAEARYSF